MIFNLYFYNQPSRAAVAEIQYFSRTVKHSRSRKFSFTNLLYSALPLVSLGLLGSIFMPECVYWWPE